MDFVVRKIRTDEIEKVADFISKGYFDDIYFHWVVDKPEDRHKVVMDYYISYISARGSVVHVAEGADGGLVGASVWLPHDLDEAVSELVYKNAGIYAKNFKEVGRKSYHSCPPLEPFYELVAVVTAKQMQGRGIGAALLKYHLDILDKKGIPTYLEA
ncbi:MAG: GNAT family N-acetyltransferase, partial [Defluviitaleaceae bacterium]|nr:GNAT family N-acetyltransferase [Defluviitaleaceae bacterium]